MSLIYSIQDLERLSGVKAHTIRIWEKRYGLFNPVRTETNIRTYNDEDVRKMLNVKSLLDFGWRISEISLLEPTELDERVWESAKAERDSGYVYDVYMHSLISAAVKFDERTFNSVFARAVEQFGLSPTMQNVIGPFLYRIGMMWTAYRLHPGQEHFSSNLLRRKLFAAIDAQVPAGQGKKYLLCLPPWEEHEIGLLYAAYLLRAAGHDVIYLGQKVPMDALSKSVEETRPAHVLIFLVKQEDPELIREYLNQLGLELNNTSVELLLAGSPKFFEGHILPEKSRLLHTPEDLLSCI